MQGPGTLLLGGANTYSGTMTLASGTLDIDSPTALGTSRLVINGGTIDNTSGSALALSPSIAMTWNSGFTFLGSSDLNLGGGSIANLTATPTINVASGVLTVGGARLLAAIKRKPPASRRPALAFSPSAIRPTD